MPPLGPQRLGVQGPIRPQFIAGGDYRDREIVDERIADALAVAYAESRQDCKSLGVDDFVAPDVSAGREAHMPNVSRHHRRDLGGAHVRGGPHGGRDPVVRRIVCVRNLAVLHQHHDRVVFGASLRVVEPCIVRNLADPYLGGIHEIGCALDVRRSPAQVVGNGRRLRRHLVIRELGEDRPIMVHHTGEIASVRVSCRRLPRR